MPSTIDTHESVCANTHTVNLKSRNYSQASCDLETICDPSIASFKKSGQGVGVTLIDFPTKTLERLNTSGFMFD